MALKNNFHPIHDHFVMRNSLVTTAGFRFLIAAASAITITVLTMAVATIHPVLTPRLSREWKTVVAPVVTPPAVLFFPRKWLRN